MQFAAKYCDTSFFVANINKHDTEAEGLIPTKIAGI